jgi:hypothetical protein
LLPTPSEGDPNGIKIKIYMFSSPKMVEIYIFRKTSVSDVIRHVMTLYRNNKELSDEAPLKYASSPDAYELRLIDYVPFYEIGPLERKDEIGEFESLAFVENKNYKPK